jgi:pimeloyl-ACP methyl ester carboxylesterase
MIQTSVKCCWLFCLLLIAGVSDLRAQQPPYDSFPPAEPPYYRVRYEASTKPSELVYAVNYTIWIPKDVKTLRGVIVHQHGCGEGSCKSGLTGAYDLHWQALAKKHDCALLSPTYEQPEKADCQLWCDPRNGSDAAFQKCLIDLGGKSGHPELAKVPWALWGHSGGGHWAGGMVLLHPDRVAAAWLRSGVPLLKADPKRTEIKAHNLLDAALKVPVMCNLGTKEGVTVKDNGFAGVWPANEAFFNEVRSKGGLVGVAIDPLSSHDCGNQRYLAIPWLDACLTARLPKAAGDPLQAMPTDKAWLAPILGGEAAPIAKYTGEALKAAWLPNEAMAKALMEYVKDTKVTDATPPPAPTNVNVQGNKLTWEAEADLESGLASFVIERDGLFLANVPEQGKNPFGRPLFQNLQYSDTPPQPLVPMQFIDTKVEAGKKYVYRVIAVNTVGLKSKPSDESTVTALTDPQAVQDVDAIPGKRVVFLGDSITQAGGYIAFTTYYLEKLYPKKDFDILCLGLASETLSGLSEDGHAGGKKDEINYDAVLAEYAKWEMNLKIPGVHVIDLHTAMRKARDGRAEAFSNDKVHPGDDGHLLMAKTILAAFDVTIPDETITAIKAEPLFRLLEQKRGMRSTAWMRHIGYTRERTVKPEPLGSTEADAAKLQEMIDVLRRQK